MNMKEFLDRYGASRRPISLVVAHWEKEESENDAGVLAAAALLAADGAIGDGLTDRISEELKESMASLMKNRVDTYGDARSYIREKLDNIAVDASEQCYVKRGVVNKIKGQVGENKFVDEVPVNARLADSGSQMGWDVACDHDGITQYVQVKMYSDPYKVVAKMKEVQERLDAGRIYDGMQSVDRVDFAVPADIADKVRELAAKSPQIADMQVIPVNMTAGEAAQVVAKGLDNLGPEATSHLLGELMQGTAAAAALHGAMALVSVARGKAEVDAALADALGNTALSACGYGAGFATEVALDTVLDALLAPTSVGAGIAARILIKRIAKSRMSAFSAMKMSNDIMRARIERLKMA